MAWFDVMMMMADVAGGGARFRAGTISMPPPQRAERFVLLSDATDANDMASYLKLMLLQMHLLHLAVRADRVW